MFSVDLAQLTGCSQQIADDAKIIARSLESMEQCQSVLRSLSGMSGVVEQMQSVVGQLEVEKKGFVQLAHTLQEVAKYYEHCEKQIKDQYEQGTVTYQKRKVSFSNLEQIDRYFKELEKE